MKNKIKYMLETNKTGFIIGCVIFTLLFVYFLFLTVNAFSNGAIAGEKSEEYYLGDCKYGKITYYGNVTEDGMPTGEGRFTVSDGAKEIAIIANTDGNSINVSTMSVTNYDEHYNTLITGTFDANDVNKISNATIRHEDINGNYGLWHGNISNKQLNETGDIYYMIPEKDIGHARIGNFIDGKLTTVVFTEDVKLSEIPPEEEVTTE